VAERIGGMEWKVEISEVTWRDFHMSFGNGRKRKTEEGARQV